MRLPIPDDWNGEYCRYAVCWPSSPKWKAVLRGLVSQAARGWSWDEKTGDLLMTLGAMRTVLPQNLELPEVIMACGDDNLNRIADALFAIARNQCCEGAPDNGGVQGSIDDGMGGTIPIYGEAPVMELPAGQIPDGYEGEYQDYLNDKCATAAAIVTGVIQTVRNFAYISFSQTAGLVTLIVLAVAGFVVLQPYLIPVLIAAAIGLVGVQAALISLANGMQDEYDNLVCALYSNDSTESILNAVSVILGAIITLIPATGAMATFLRLVAGLLFSTDTINQLFTMQAGFAPPHDCSGCDDPSVGPWNVSRGSNVTDGQWFIEADADWPAGCGAASHRVNVEFDVSAEQRCTIAPTLGGTARLVRVSVVSGEIVQTANPKLRVTGADNSNILSTNVLPWTGELQARRVSLLGDVGTAYRVKLEFAGEFGQPIQDPLP